MNKGDHFSKLIRELYKVRREMSDLHNMWNFTLDGRLVGDIGEAHAYTNYDLQYLGEGTKDHDFKTPCGKMVQVKITQKDKLGLGITPPQFEYLLAFKLYPDGKIEEIYNGLGSRVYSRPGKASRKSVSLKMLAVFRDEVDPSERVQARKTQAL